MRGQNWRGSKITALLCFDDGTLLPNTERIRRQYTVYDDRRVEIMVAHSTQQSNDLESNHEGSSAMGRARCGVAGTGLLVARLAISTTCEELKRREHQR